MDTVRNLGFAPAFILLLAAPAIAASNPCLGTWHLKLSEAGQKPETLIYSDAGGGAMRMVSVEDGSVIITHFDGRPAVDHGAGAAQQLALAIKRISLTRYDWTGFKGGKPWIRGTNILAADRRSFQETSWLIYKPEKKHIFVYEQGAN